MWDSFVSFLAGLDGVDFGLWTLHIAVSRSVGGFESRTRHVFVVTDRVSAVSCRAKGAALFFCSLAFRVIPAIGGTTLPFTRIIVKFAIHCRIRCPWYFKIYVHG